MTAIERCKQYGEAVVYIEDEALQREWSAIEADLQRPPGRVYVSGPTGGTVRFGESRRIRTTAPVPAPKEIPVKVLSTPSP